MATHTILAHVNVPKWLEENAGAFQPPVGNKLLHRGELSIMFVGGPNARTDFHSEEGSEFFYQLRESAQVVTIQDGKRTPVTIPENAMYLLPSRVPHSPQRKAGSIGLVIERERLPGELDRMSWYKDFETCEELLWEKYFVCTDLGKDLVPVVNEFNAWKSSPNPSALPRAPVADAHVPFCRAVPSPKMLDAWIQQHREVLSSARGARVPIFGDDHPDQEFEIVLEGHGEHRWQGSREVFLYQLVGEAHVHIENGGPPARVRAGDCCVVRANDSIHSSFSVRRDAASSIGLVVRVRDVRGNRSRSKL